MIKKHPTFLIILAGCMWGTISLFIIFFEEMGIYDSITKVFILYFGSAVVSIIFVLFYNKHLFIIRLEDLIIFIGAGTVCVGFDVAFYFNVVQTSVNFALVLLYTSPIWVLIISVLFFKEKVNLRKITALICGVLGCALVSGLVGEMGFFSVTGLIIGLLSGFGYGMYTIISTFALKKGYHPLTINTWTFTIAAVGCLILGVRFDQIGHAICQAPGFSISYMFVYATFCSGVPYALYTLGLKNVEAGKAAILASCDPVVGTIGAMLLFNQYPSIYGWTGMMFVISALMLLNLPIKKNNNSNKRY